MRRGNDGEGRDRGWPRMKGERKEEWGRKWEWGWWVSVGRAGEPAALLGVTADFGWARMKESLSVSKSKSKSFLVPSFPGRFFTRTIKLYPVKDTGSCFLSIPIPNTI
jgi:hypothetical protein